MFSLFCISKKFDNALKFNLKMFFTDKKSKIYFLMPCFNDTFIEFIDNSKARVHKMVAQKIGSDLKTNSFYLERKFEFSAFLKDIGEF